MSKYAKRLTIVVAILFFICAVVFAMPFGQLFDSARVETAYAADFAGGAGTESDPYIIKTAAQLDAVRNFLGESNIGVCFKLANDIDLTDYLSAGGAGYNKWADGGWMPIGSQASFFQRKI